MVGRGWAVICPRSLTRSVFAIFEMIANAVPYEENAAASERLTALILGRVQVGVQMAVPGFFVSVQSKKSR